MRGGYYNRYIYIMPFRKRQINHHYHYYLFLLYIRYHIKAQFYPLLAPLYLRLHHQFQCLHFHPQFQCQRFLLIRLYILQVLIMIIPQTFHLRCCRWWWLGHLLPLFVFPHFDFAYLLSFFLYYCLLFIVFHFGYPWFPFKHGICVCPNWLYFCFFSFFKSSYHLIVYW